PCAAHFVTPGDTRQGKPSASLRSAGRRRAGGTRARRNSAAGGRGRRRSAYEAPRAAADRGTPLGGAESKRRRRPRLPAPPSRVTLLICGEQTAQHTPLTARARLRESPPTARPTPVQGGPGRRRGSDAYAQRARDLRARLPEPRAAGVRRRRDLRRRPRLHSGGKPAGRVGARAGRARLRARPLQAASVRVPDASLSRAPE